MAAALQPFVPPARAGRKTERVLKVRPIEISLDVADAIVAELHNLAEGRTIQELEQRLRWTYRNNPQATRQMDPAAVDEDDFVRRNTVNPDVRAGAQISSYERYTFLAPDANVQYEGSDFHISDVPKDINVVIARGDGVNGRFIELRLQTKFKDFSEVRNEQLNQILIQGDDLNWVNAAYERLRGLIEPQYLKTRQVIYGNCLKFFWSSVVLLLFAEYRITKWVQPSFNLQSPLSGTGALVMFGVLTASVVVFANTIIAAFTCWFPFFEIEQNLSRSRTASRKLVLAVLMAIYTAAAVNVVALVFGPILKRLVSSS